MCEEEPETVPPVADETTGRVRFCLRRCTTCVFRPGNLMHLGPRRLKQMVEAANAREGHIVCHQTLPAYGKGLPGAVCRGYEQHPDAAQASLAVRWARITGLATLVDTDTGQLADIDYRNPPPREEN